MLIRVTKAGLHLITPLVRADGQVRQTIGGEARYYFVGSDPTIPLILVVYAGEPREGEVWEASSGNEVGYPGFCWPDHEGMKIGKLTLRYPVHPVPKGREIVDLDAQINYFISRFSS